MRRSFVLTLAAPAFATLALAQPPAAPTTPPTPPAQTGAPAGQENAVAATVNGESITLTEVDTLLKGTLPLTPLTVAQKRQMRIEVLSDIIDDLLLRQFLRKNGPKVDPAEIDAQLKAFGDKLKKDGKSLADFFKETGQTEAQVRESWTTAMQLTGYVKLNTTEEQLKAYFNANKDFFDHVEVKVQHVVLRVSKNATAVDRATAKEKLEAIRAEIAAGKLDFATAAKKNSHCPSAPNGGDIGYIARKGGLVDEAFAKAAFAMKSNELSGVIETDFGLHILQVTDRKPGTPSTYEKSATEVLDTYSDDFRTELIAKLRKQGQIQITVP
ncbi:-type peptidyl-prolyl cis-trans isomerase : Peptidylprolyl isomerase OS=Candidatus Kuenenia stuttgartiensis GN=surA PE=4 SV=1: SurA_N_3: Rotamase [Gemmata massiliana]|uniref:PpiC domain-containing protein n=1 Tax=Gemmata massiliana TaxID=1210884 RepID=A0A6P2D463_9BACT|nr:peptidylprolyl isomerase [Gemmata massiliana]VTR94242.1 -type peptidyl-prolyl cis-trans isomerase : Peptidylprolyl isomerase OS=Candidatus Kuenenia stuttgartiensis GN=surA PE=4 SV=1: SurA_N_3: Rotamase [Gemmata massiliana]